jgi:integrase
MSHKKEIGKNRWRLVAEAGKDGYGNRKRLVRIFNGTEKQADKELARLELEAEQGQKFEASQKPLGEYLLYWVDSIAKPDLAANTYESYRWEIENHIIPIMGHIPLAYIGTAHIQEFYTYKSQSGRLDGKGGLSNRSIVYLHSILNKALAKAVSLEYIQKNPCDTIKPPRDKKRPGQGWVILDAHQLDEFLANCRGHRDYYLIHLAGNSGARQSELLGLEWERILWHRNTIRITQALHRMEKKAPQMGLTKNDTSTRDVEMSASDMAVLREYWEAKGKPRKGLVFPDLDGGYMRGKNLSKRFSNLAFKHGYEGMRFHDLRHTHATILLSAGINPRAVSERLGHANVETTLSIYGHALPKDRTMAANCISNIIKASKKKPAKKPKAKNKPSGTKRAHAESSTSSEKN